ncbi:MAG: hypothetical protein HY796_04410 [Elusimicrobia bacterium]|nr:hypothetical protein [Elusimicrobiota bacterium]
MVLDSNALRLKEKIEAAFADVPYPGDNNLVETRIPEDLDAVKYFRGVKWQDWKDKPAEFLNSKANDYSFFLSPAAFRYYLPLYMILVLTDYAASGNRAGEIITSLEALGAIDKKIRDHAKRQLSPMTAAQLKVILEYLEFFKRKHGADYIIEDIDSAITNLQIYAK